eukprot:s3724_g4.t1
MRLRRRSYDRFDCFSGLQLKFAIFHKFLLEYRSHRRNVVLVQYIRARFTDSKRRGMVALEELQRMADETNKHFAVEGEGPVVKIVVEETSREKQLGVLLATDILLDTSTNDGLNLIPFNFYAAHSQFRRAHFLMAPWCWLQPAEKPVRVIILALSVVVIFHPMTKLLRILGTLIIMAGSQELREVWGALELLVGLLLGICPGDPPCGAQLAAMPDAGQEVPTWDGDPGSFDNFANSCKWYECSLKDADRKLAAPRIWQRLAGAAKSVVRHLDPKEFDTPSGLERLLDILRQSPLQKLPIPDSFSRLERWPSLRRNGGEAISHLLIREEELFVELQNALSRARSERDKVDKVTTGVGAGERDPSESPSRSPQGIPGVRPGVEVPGQASFYGATPSPMTSPGTTSTTGASGFFEDEMRGYRLLKAARLSAAERQHVMTLTKNSTHFHQVRQALRSLFSEDFQEDGTRMPKKTWYADAVGEEWDPEWDDADEATAWWSDDSHWEDAAYWADWSPSTSWGDDYYYEDYDATSINDETYGQSDAGAETSEESKKVEEAYQLAVEANRTLAEAKAAVAKVRAARGYYDPMGMKGTGKSKGKGKSKTSGKKGSTMGPCFTCGRMGHSYLQCPDRYSKGAVKGKGKMKGSKGKKAYFVEYPTYFMNYDSTDYNIPNVNVLSLQDSEYFHSMPSQKVILDTGATESVAGVAAMSRLVEQQGISYHVTLNDRPSFKFGNGQCQRAVSRIHMVTSAMGDLDFYLLDQGADLTPPLLGARELRRRHAMISYKGDWLAYKAGGTWWASALETTPSGHLALDLFRPREPLHALLGRLRQGHEGHPGGHRLPPGVPGDGPPGDDDGDGDGPHAKRFRGHADSTMADLVQATAESGAYGGDAAVHANVKVKESPSPARMSTMLSPLSGTPTWIREQNAKERGEGHSPRLSPVTASPTSLAPSPSLAEPKPEDEVRDVQGFPPGVQDVPGSSSEGNPSPDLHAEAAENMADADIGNPGVGTSDKWEVSEEAGPGGSSADPVVSSAVAEGHDSSFLGPSVMMVMRSDDYDDAVHAVHPVGHGDQLGDRLSCLAQRLRVLQEQLHPVVDESGGPRSGAPHQGDTRSVGPPSGLVHMAQEELQVLFNAEEVTEKIFQGKLMEIKGRNLVATGRGTMAVNVRADERMGKWMMGEDQEEPTCGYERTKKSPSKTSAPETPDRARASTTPTRTTRTPSQEPIPVGAVVTKAKAKAIPARVKKEKSPVPAETNANNQIPEQIDIASDSADSDVVVVPEQEAKNLEPAE